jgi:hypothetical protein
MLTLIEFTLIVIWFVIFVCFCIIAYRVGAKIESKGMAVNQAGSGYLYPPVVQSGIKGLATVISSILVLVGLFHPLVVTYPAIFGTMPATRMTDGTIKELPYGVFDPVYGLRKVIRMKPDEAITCSTRPPVYINSGALQLALLSPWPWDALFKRSSGYETYKRYWTSDDLCRAVNTVILGEVQRQFSGSDIGLTWSDREASDKKGEEIRAHLSEALRAKFSAEGIELQKVY